METKLCRICGKLGENYVHIFKTEGLKNKIETCLPIIVSPHCLLPDTICSKCLENVDNFYSFIKNCLQNIIVLEAQYDITESCLKTKRKHEKGCLTDFTVIRFDKNIQTDDDCDKFTLVSYEVESDTTSDVEDHFLEGKVVIAPKSATKKVLPPPSLPAKTLYFDNAENDLISEITLRKSLKRKSDDILPYRTKMFKMDTSNRRKNKQPKKLEYRFPNASLVGENKLMSFSALERICEQMEKNVAVDFADIEKLGEFTEEDKQVALEQVEKEIHSSLHQICLLCDTRFPNPAALASHVYEFHGIDMTQAQQNSDPTAAVIDKKKKIPNLVKITDLKPKSENSDDPKQPLYENNAEEPPTLQPSYVCPICPATLTNRGDLFAHLKARHAAQAALLCGLCLHIFSSYAHLNSHLETCKTHHNITAKYICKVCCYSDENSKNVENHVTVHDFILAFCKKQAKMFDPSDYVEVNVNCEGSVKSFTCSECDEGGFGTFKEFSTHRRSQHQIFHCDLCNKFYGRNSHLWKHVNRLHKGHPSITCQLCYKTSASKYHLAQHFNKIHSAKPCKQKHNEEEDFMSQKFRAFDFQSVKQSFMRQEMLDKEKKNADSDDAAQVDGISDAEENSNQEDEDELNEYMQNITNSNDAKKEETLKSPPKEIDSTSDLYTNIITNYTPPQNEGEFKCPKCFKGFHKKTLLKKHKKNCRPRLQKDLLTRCKTCSRIFKDRQSLTKHLINYHSEYTCEICNQKFQSKCEIVSHIRFSHPRCHLFCHCGNILRNKADLTEHKRDHRNSFVCQFCGDMLPTKIKLKMHILSLHRKILSLSCGICLKLFETQFILRDHVRLVHKEHLTPLTSCTVCGKNYGSKWKTYDHLNKSHGRIFKACKACLEVFESEDDMQKHYSLVHANMAAQGKNNVGQNATTPTAFKKDNYDSDYEQMNDENFEENALSETSNDAETYYNAKTSQYNENDEQKVNDFRGFDETRISLLEKRLLGKKASSEPVKTKPVLKVPNEQKKVKKVDYDEGDLNCSQNPLQNSSKRTVYVNSNDPSLCEICNKIWPAKKHLWQHYIRCHKTVAATVCGICLKTNKDYVALQEHLRENHPTLLHGQGFGSNFICRICGRYHNASSKLKLHMAIHETFDWSMLEGGSNSDHTQNSNSKQTKNGFKDEPQQEQEGDDINYESLIEQVECSSDSDVDDSDNTQKAESSTDDEEESAAESGASENSLETQMLHNMLKETKTDVKTEIKSEEVDIKDEYTSSDSEDTSNSSYSDTEYDNNEVKNESSEDESPEQQRCGSNSNTNDSSSYGRKPGELDSAIRSISYEQEGNVDDEEDEDYCEIQTQSLNENEIESAVDSIL